VGRHAGPWAVLWSDAVDSTLGARVRFRLVDGDAFKVEIASEPPGEARCEAVLTWQASFLDAGAGYERGADPPIARGFWNEVLLLRAGGKARLYVNGRLLVESASPGQSAETGESGESGRARIGLGVENGLVEVQSVSNLAR